MSSAETVLPQIWTDILRFALKNKGKVKTSSIRNKIAPNRYSAEEARAVLDRMASSGYLEREKVGQVFVYTITNRGREAAKVVIE